MAPSKTPKLDLRDAFRPVTQDRRRQDLHRMRLQPMESPIIEPRLSPSTSGDGSCLNPTWTSESTVTSDWTFHQIAPHIGRIKSSMAWSLVQDRTRRGDLIADPFCGCGVVALEAAANGRRIVAGDWNPYAALLTRAKPFPPRSQQAAEHRLRDMWKLSRERFGEQDLRTVPV